MGKLLKARSLLLIFLCALCWGPSYLFIKIAVGDIPPLCLVFFRVAIGCGILYTICLLQKLNPWHWKGQWRHFVFLGITLNALPFFLISFGELYISSSLAGILNSFTLIFTAILSHFFGVHDPFTKNKLLGVVLGILGLGMIYIPLVIKEGIKNDIGALLIILACLSYAIGTVYARGHLQGKIPGNVVLTAQLAIAALVMIPLVLIIDHPFSLPFPSYSSIASVIGLGVLGTAAGFIFYYKAIQAAGATYASFSVLLVPILAMVLGAVFLNEELTWNLYVGTFLILTGVLAVNPAFNKI